jgi:gamma-glutamyl-gamma-aminobutyrate hydrolase PuuD
VRVRSGHHQGVRRVGARLRVTATSPDGLPEGIERTDRRFAVGVQWRPQTDPGAPGNRRLAEALVTAAGERWPRGPGSLAGVRPGGDTRGRG